MEGGCKFFLQCYLISPKMFDWRQQQPALILHLYAPLVRGLILGKSVTNNSGTTAKLSPVKVSYYFAATRIVDNVLATFIHPGDSGVGWRLHQGRQPCFTSRKRMPQITAALVGFFSSDRLTPRVTKTSRRVKTRRSSGSMAKYVQRVRVLNPKSARGAIAFSNDRPFCHSDKCGIRTARHSVLYQQEIYSANSMAAQCPRQ